MKAVVVMGGALKKDARSGVWRTTRFNEMGDKFGTQGDRLRVVAGAMQYKNNPDNIIVIALGGKGQLRRVKDVEPLSSVLKRELIELGVPEEKIIRESRSGTTYSQLVELKKIVKKMSFKEVIIISNRWHLPRIKAMMDHSLELEGFYKLADIKLVSAEAVVIKDRKKRWGEIIRRAYALKSLKERIRCEQEGVRQIKSGTYKYVGRYS